MSLSDQWGGPFYQPPSHLGPMPTKSPIKLSKPRLVRVGLGQWHCTSKEGTGSGGSPVDAYLGWAEMAPMLVEWRLRCAEEDIKKKRKAMEIWEQMNAHQP